MNPVIIPIHSFVDLITNSSSETYINADKNTVEAIKLLVDNILKSGGSDKKCDDLFKVELNHSDIVVTPLNNDETTVAAASRLASLTNIFEISGEYNG